ncbi:MULTISPECIES: chorismate lyase [Gammaproteobacteria]|uniref:chorismate--pyruvate lyase family protein n=1 Tax=Gammaproteobacteria TaxID=1236 RepID=UPI001403E1E2|nr:MULTISPECIES: chorismate lyase [Gammaproteobacteria]
MQIKSFFPVGMEASWQTELPQLEPNLNSWLNDAGSLTAKLKALSNNFRVELLGQQQLHAHNSEIQFLGITDTHLCIVREVLLNSDDESWVFARSVLPVSSLSDEDQALAEMGNNPLGEVLFQNSSIVPGDIQVAQFDQASNVVRLDNTLHANSVTSLFGRRRLFHLQNGPILVAEVFLSAAPCYAESKASI